MEETGIVMEVHRKWMVVFTSTGEFKRVPIYGRPPELGAEVPLAGINRRITSWQKFTGYVAVAAVLLFALITPFMSGIFSPEAKTTVAYVSVDINPSINMGINSKDEVVFVQPCNTDAENLLEKISVKGQSVQKAVQVITEAAIHEGFITQEKENTVVVAIAPLSRKTEVKHLESSLVESAQSILKAKKLGAVVEAIHTDDKVRKEAEKKGLSVGKYAILLEAQHGGVKVTVDDMKKLSINDALKKAGGDTVAILEQAKHNTDDITDNEALARKNTGTTVNVLRKQGDPEAAGQDNPTDSAAIVDVHGSDSTDVLPPANPGNGKTVVIGGQRTTVNEGQAPDTGQTATPEPPKPAVLPADTEEPTDSSGDITDQLPENGSSPQKVLDKVYENQTN